MPCLQDWTNSNSGWRRGAGHYSRGTTNYKELRRCMIKSEHLTRRQCREQSGV
jgi:hypothetical protein